MPRLRFSPFAHCLTRALLWGAVLGSTLAGRTAASGHEALERQFSDLFAQVAQHPEDARLFFQLADLHIQHQDWPAALACVDTVERLSPGQFATEPLRGQAFILAGNPTAARAAFDRFLVQHPESVAVLIFRAHLRQEAGDAAGAIADLHRALQHSARPEPDLVLEIANSLVAAGRMEDARAQLAEGLARLGAAPALLLRLVELEVAAGLPEAALARLAAMEKAAPRAEPWMAQRARLLTAAGRPAEAHAVWEALLQSLAEAPPRVRTAHAMTLLAEQARLALAQP